MPSKKALVRRPGPRLAEGLVTHIEREKVDVDLALEQWEAYVEALRTHGWETIEVDPEDDCPDSVFVEDTVVMYKNVALIARPGAESRREETTGVEEAVAGLGCSVNWIWEPGTLDGGDVLKIGDTVYVGRGGRTNAAGVRQLRAAFEPLGARVVAVPVSKVLHLKSAVTALPDGTVIGHIPKVDTPSLFARFLPVPEEAGLARRPARRRQAADGGERAEDRRAVRRPRVRTGRRGHQRVREARGMCDVPLGAAAGAVRLTGRVHHPPAPDLRVPGPVSRPGDTADQRSLRHS